MHRLRCEQGRHVFRDQQKPAYLDGEFIGIVGIVSDITEQKQLETKLKNLTENDQLTGLYNRNYLKACAKARNFDGMFPVNLDRAGLQPS